MAEIALKSIKFPGLANTYTIPQIDTTLTQSGQAADAQAVGNKFTEVSTIAGNAFPTDTLTGDIVTFADGADDVPMKSVVVNIEPVQSGSGDPSPDNVRPISGWTGVQVARTEKNIWDEEWIQGTISSANGIYYPGTNSICSKNYMIVLPNTLYYSYFGSVEGGTNLQTRFYDANKNYIGHLAKNGSAVMKNAVFRTPENACYMKFQLQAGYGTTYNHDISINYPSTDHDYHPSSAKSYSITFTSEAGTVYGGVLDVTNGVLTVDRAMVDLGTLEWIYQSDFQRFNSQGIANTVKKPLSNSVAVNAICSDYAVKSTNNVAQSVDGLGVSTSGTIDICDTTKGTDPTTFKTAMNGVMLCYELATPITYHLTHTEIKSLQGENYVWADAGNIEITYRADPNLYIDKRIGTEAPMVATDNIVSGNYFMVGNNLYKATANIASGAAVVVGTNATAKTMAEALNEINA